MLDGYIYFSISGLPDTAGLGKCRMGALRDSQMTALRDPIIKRTKRTYKGDGALCK